MNRADTASPAANAVDMQGREDRNLKEIGTILATLRAANEFEGLFLLQPASLNGQSDWRAVKEFALLVSSLKLHNA